MFRSDRSILNLGLLIFLFVCNVIAMEKRIHAIQKLEKETG